MDLNQWASQPLDRHSPVPLYQQLSDLLAEAISVGQLKSGDQLPSENDLISCFNVSRFVVRQTLNNLGRQGLIRTEQGRGSFVTAQKIVKPLDILQSYHVGMKKAGIEVDVRILTKSIITPPSEIARQLALKHNEKTLLLERVAYSNGAPLNLLVSYIALGKDGGSKSEKFEGGSLYDFLASECNITLNSSQNNIEIIFAGEYESRLLNSVRGAVLLQILSVSYDKSGKPVEHSRVVYPGSLFRFQFDSSKPDGSVENKALLIR
ncbi:GntR family transcriptional regulator [bacterium]|nr:MAG: GntR family transcriptional regulator [bacterium]